MDQVELSILKLEDLIQEYKAMKHKNIELRNSFTESKKKIAVLN